MNKRVLVTGASRGIGRAIALQLASSGFKVLVNFKSNEQAAQEVVKEITAAGGDAELCPFDVADRAAAKAAIEAQIEAKGPLYGMVHSAGITIDKPFPALEGDDWDQV